MQLGRETILTANSYWYMGNEQPSSKENATPAENVTTMENTTIVGTPEENVTTVDNKTEEDVTTADNKTEENTNNMTTGRLAISSPNIQDTPYLVRLQNYKSSSSSLAIKKGEKVSWLNLHGNLRTRFRFHETCNYKPIF